MYLDKQKGGIRSAEKHWIVGKKPVYFKDVLTSEWKSGNVLHQGRGFVYIFTGDERLWAPSKLITIQVREAST